MEINNTTEKDIIEKTLKNYKYKYNKEYVTSLYNTIEKYNELVDRGLTKPRGYTLHTYKNIFFNEK